MSSSSHNIWFEWSLIKSLTLFVEARGVGALCRLEHSCLFEKYNALIAALPLSIKVKQGQFPVIVSEETIGELNLVLGD